MKYKSSVNEWYNSIYTYNLKKLNIILHDKNKIINILLNSYFNLKKLNNRKYNIKLKSLFSTNLKSFFNTNNINEKYINKNKIKKLRKWKLYKISYIKWFNKKKNMKVNKSLNRIFLSFPYFKHTNNNLRLLVFVFDKYKLLLLNKMRKLNKLLKKKQKNNIITLNNISYINLKNSIIKNIIYKKKFIIFKKSYLSLLYLNIFKYNNINITNIKNIIAKIYDKKININIINMKYLYLDNNNLIQAITRKLNDRKKKVLKILKKTLKLVKLAKVSSILSNLKKYKIFSVYNFNIKLIYNNIINSLKNKHLIGIFLEAKGRLTRRMTASRAVYKLRYKGNMKNSYNINKSTKLYRGYIKPNLIINKSNSYNKNGSFGITSKINTY